MGLFTRIREYSKTVIGYSEIKRQWQWIGDMASKTISPKGLLARSRKETFQEAVKRVEATEQSLYSNYENFALTFKVSIAYAGLCVVLSLMNSFLIQAFIPALAYMSIFIMMMCNAFRFSFRAYQIKSRNLCTPKEWWDNPQEWIPNTKTYNRNYF